MTTATPTRPDFREQQADDAPKWWREFSDLERSVVLITMVVIIIAGALYGLGASFTLISDFAPNVMTEILFFAFTIVVIDRLNRQRSKNERKEELILQMGSSDNGFALEAVRLLRHYGWSKDGSLQGVNLNKANLQGANLTFAKLQGANLNQATLQEALLIEVDLRGADLVVANLKEASLSDADLQRAKLGDVKLHEAYLVGAKLQGADLSGATLPDGTVWSPDVDMRKFTDPDHPDFWQPDWVKDE